MPILFFGSEDSDLVAFGAAAVDTTAGRFNPRVQCGLAVPPPPAFPLANFWRSIGQFSAADFWLTAKFWSNASALGTLNNRNSAFLMRFLDANAIPRLVISSASAIPSFNPTSPGPWIVQTVDAAGNYTTIGSAAGFTGPAVGTLQPITVQVDYTTPGTVRVYINGSLVFRHDGDVTTDGVTALAGFDLGEPCLPNSASTGTTVWSEIIVADFDTRSLDLYKLDITGRARRAIGPARRTVPRSMRSS